MKSMIIVTGAAGHLGNTLIRKLETQEVAVRGLLLPGETGESATVEYITGDVRDIESLRPLFEDTERYDVYLIHTAGIIDISEKITPALYDVNVKGTRNIIALCKEYSVKRLVYVSSVHAIPELDNYRVIEEVTEFSPEEVVGGYAKTKAEATQAVMEAAEQGMDAVIVHPSGILGPYDKSNNHLVQTVNDYIHRRLPASIQGGYDFVDVRDAADGCLLALEKGEAGECYILSNRYYTIKELLSIIRSIYGGRKLPVFPMWFVKMVAPLMQWIAKLRNKRPLYTKYSLYTLTSNARFSHDKATHKLGYRPRDLLYTIMDTVEWLKRKETIPAVA